MGAQFGRGRIRVVALAVVAVAALLPQAAVAAQPATAAQTVRAPACQGEYRNDARLGPATLPAVWEEPVGRLLAGYQRTGALTPQQFLAQYWDANANGGQGSWIYPPDDGFLMGANGELMKWETTLTQGTELDRFGSEFGSYLAPAGALYLQRALPPQSLNTYAAAYPCNYHRYQVTKAFKVFEGLVAGWFEQPGLGRQIKLDRSLLPGEGRISVAWLLTNGYIARL